MTRKQETSKEKKKEHVIFMKAQLAQLYSRYAITQGKHLSRVFVKPSWNVLEDDATFEVNGKFWKVDSSKVYKLRHAAQNEAIYSVSLSCSYSVRFTQKLLSFGPVYCPQCGHLFSHHLPLSHLNA